jgi:hypothetical protein
MLDRLQKEAEILADTYEKKLRTLEDLGGSLLNRAFSQNLEAA